MGNFWSNTANGSFKETRRKTRKQVLDDFTTSSARGIKRNNLREQGKMPNSNPFHQLLKENLTEKHKKLEVNYDN